MRIVLSSAPLLRPDADVSDLTASELVGSPHWVDGTTLVLPFDPEPSAAEQRLIRRRLMTEDAAHEAWVSDVVDAVSDLDALPSLTPAERLLRLLAAGAVRGIEPDSQEV